MVEPESNEPRKPQATHPDIRRVDSELAATDCLNNSIRRQVEQNARDARQLREQIELYRQQLRLDPQKAQRDVRSRPVLIDQAQQHRRQHPPTPEHHQSADLDLER